MSSVADDASKCGAQRSAGPRRQAAKQGRGKRSVPLQEQEFGAEAGSECGGHRNFIFLERALFQPLLKDKKNRSAREIADVAEDVPRRFGVAIVQSEGLLHIAEQPRAAG